MSALKKGQKLHCKPCGREVIISNGGVSTTTLWCCETPMEIKKSAVREKTIKKTLSKKQFSSKKKTPK